MRVLEEKVGVPSWSCPIVEWWRGRKSGCPIVEGSRVGRGGAGKLEEMSGVWDIFGVVRQRGHFVMRVKVYSLVLAGAGCALLLGSGWLGQQWLFGSAPLAGGGVGSCGAVPVAGQAPQRSGMVWIEAGRFTMGSANAYPEEWPPVERSVEGFWMDQTEVTNAQFAAFVDATGYVTLAERGISDLLNPDGPGRKGSAVFIAPPEDAGINPFVSWWRFVDGADWRHPQGPQSSIKGLDSHPVVHIAYEDAEAYAAWLGHRLPSEAQFEFAAAGNGRKNGAGEHIANTWQGFFPFQHEAVDGYAGTAPVACYSANAHGVHDLIGNVWEWTSSPYYEGHATGEEAAYPQGYDPNQPEEPAVAVIKGGSYLCAPNYCMRYRPEARQGQSQGLGTSHIGFRTVLVEN